MQSELHDQAWEMHKLELDCPNLILFNKERSVRPLTFVHQIIQYDVTFGSVLLLKSSEDSKSQVPNEE